VDDGSTDETPQRLAEVEDQRLSGLRQPTAMGDSRARNTAIAAARGDWLAFLDDDDLWSPRKLRAQLDRASDAAATLVYTGAVAVDEQRRVLAALPLPDPEALSERLRWGSSIPAGPSNVMVRADLVRQVGGFDETMSHSADWDLWIRLVRKARVASCEEVLVARVEHPRRMLFRDRPDVVREVETLMRRHYPNHRRQRGGLDEWLAMEHFEAGFRVRAAGLFLRAALRGRRLGNIPPALGALFGERGMRVASHLLVAFRGRSHLRTTNAAPPAEPPWLALHR
jgi:glycosyltransferase involved in cell wall biosynthesis